MKRRVLAILCVLSILMGMVVMPATAATTDSTEASTYNVGYAKVDLNPFIKTDATKEAVGDLGIEPNDAYVDAETYVGQITIQTSETETATVDFVKTPLGGYGDVSTRLADKMTDDNGDGIVGLGDGLFGTATSVTDSLGNTVIYITMDFLNGNANLTKAVREKVVAELGVDNIAANQIMISGSHSHEAPDFYSLYNAWNTYDKNGIQFSARGTYWQYLIDQLTSAAVTAYENATPATMSKGSIEAPVAMKALGEAAGEDWTYDGTNGYKLNFVRNYKVTKVVESVTMKRDMGWGWGDWYESSSTVTSTTEWYIGDNFGSATAGVTTVEGSYNSLTSSSRTDTRTTVTLEHATEGNQTMNLMQFTPTSSDAKPIVMVEWRAHASINGQSSYTNLSSDYINALRYRLENNKTLFGGDTDYCVGFWQGAAGNNNNSSKISTEYAYNTDDPYVENVDNADLIVYTGYPSITLNDMGEGNDVKVPLELDAINAGSGFYYDYYTTGFGTTHSSYTDQFYRNALYGYILGKVAIYGLNNSMTQVTDYGEIRCIQNNYVTERQIWSEDYFLAAFEAKIVKGYTTNSTDYYPYDYTAADGSIITLNSYYHANAILVDYTYSYNANTKVLEEGYAPKTTPVTMELNAILMGSQVALVTGTGELFDYYDENSATTAAENDWNELVHSNTYGTPFTLSYTNNSTGYAPNTLAYDFPTNEAGTSVGSYEANTTDFAKGTGEAVIDEYARLLNLVDKDNVTYKCQHCGTVEEWTPLFSSDANSDLTSGHYFMVDDLVGTDHNGQQMLGTSDGTTTVDVCLDLNGHTYSSESRCAIVYKGSTLNIMNMIGVDGDGNAVENKYSGTGGKMIGMTNSNNPAGGAFSVSSGATVNLYGGTLEFQQRDKSIYGKEYNTGFGAVFSLSGTLNMFGGTIVGSDFGTVYPYSSSGSYIGLGGAIYVAGGATLNMSGGSITSGSVPEGGAGPCVYLASSTSKVKLSGNASIEDIYYRYNGGSNLTVSGTYTGTTNLTFNDSSDTTFTDSITLTQNLDIGDIASGADISGAKLTCSNQKADGVNWQVRTSGTNLVLYGYNDTTQAVIVDGTSEPEYTSLSAAISAYTSNGSNYIKLIRNPDDTAVTISKDTYLDLNGLDVSAAINAEAAPLYVMDSMTDDYNVSDSYGYGKLTSKNNSGTIEGVPVDSEVAADGYLKVDESGDLSFHRVNLQIDTVVLRPRDTAQDPEGVYNPDMYYKITEGFSADSVVAGLVDSYGIAMLADDGDSSNGEEIPTADTLNDLNHSKYTGFTAGKGKNTGAGTLLTDVLQETNNILINRRNANIAVYGRAYIEIDGQYMFGGYRDQTLKSLVQAINEDSVWNTLSTEKKEGMVNLYKTYSSIFGSWKLTNVEAEMESEEYNSLKILVVGNSHGLDATNLLYEVFEDQKTAEGYVAITEDGEERVYDNIVIGNLYHSGESMKGHAAAANDTVKNYSYHEIGTDGATGTKWQKDLETYDDTMYYGLQQHEWDIVVMQQMNHRSGINDNTDDSYNFNQSEYKTVASYIMNNCKNGVQPKLAWHMVWTNPDDGQFFDGTEDTTDTEYCHSDESWVTNHNTWYGTDGRYDQSNLYNAMVEALQTKILSDNYFGYDIDYVLPSAVAVEYAQDILGCTDAQMYRDWTHISDFGRLMVAYTWWAELMGYDSIGVDIIGEIPAALSSDESGKNAYPAVDADGKYIVDGDMKSIITKSVNYALSVNDPTFTDTNAYEIAEDNGIAILGIGNSYTMDCMWMLPQIYAAENPGKTVKLGIAYISGGNLQDHANGEALGWFNYWDSTTETWQYNYDMTLDEAIAYADWDLVSLQQGSTKSVDASTYDDSIQTIQSKVTNILGYTPEFFWNQTWAWPTDPLRDGYTVAQQTAMYNNVVSAVQQKIVPDRTFSMIMPVGVAIQNANSVLDDADLYCDNTHVGAYGRLIAGYVLYCQLENVASDALTTLKVTETPADFSKIHGKETEAKVDHSENMLIALEAVRNALITGRDCTFASTDLTDLISG